MDFTVDMIEEAILAKLKSDTALSGYVKAFEIDWILKGWRVSPTW